MMKIELLEICPDLAKWSDRKDSLFRGLPVCVRETSWELMEQPISDPISRIELYIKEGLGD